MNSKIISFGEVMMRLETPEYKLLTQTNSLEYSFTGTGVNVASAMKKLGHEGYLVSRLPDNPIGEAALSYIRGLGVQEKFIVRGGDYLGMYFLENGIDARPSRVTYTNRVESSFNTASLESYDINSIVKQADVVHFCGISLAISAKVRESMKLLAKRIKENGGKVIFDCNFRSSLWEGGYAQARSHYEEMLMLADIVMMNEKDAIYTLGFNTKEIDKEKQLKQVIPKVAEYFNITTIAGTHRSISQGNMHTLEGFIYKNSKLAYSDKLSFLVYDRIGSGDAFAAGILHSELVGFPLEKSVQFASASGMLACTIDGDIPMSTEKEIMAVISNDFNDIQR